MKFYEVIDELNKNVENRMITVCDGNCAGEKMIISAGDIVFADEGGFLMSHEDEARQAKEGQVTLIDGTRVFSEILGNEKELVICGAGHVSMPVIEIAKMMGFHVTAIDDREEFINRALRHGADEVLCMGFEEALSGIAGSPDTFFVIVTRGHMSDSECLLSIVKKPYAYVGMIGSKRKVSKVKSTLADAGIASDVIESVHTPIGLDIGAETPEEIAVAIMAEIIEVKNKKKRNFGFPKDIMRQLLSDERGPSVLATIVSKQGSSPRGEGTRMLVNAGGSITGTIGGGLAEAGVIEKARAILSEGNKKQAEPVLMSIDMTGQDAATAGMICGGAIDVLLETV